MLMGKQDISIRWKGSLSQEEAFEYMVEAISPPVNSFLRDRPNRPNSGEIQEEGCTKPEKYLLLR